MLALTEELFISTFSLSTKNLWRSFAVFLVLASKIRSAEYEKPLMFIEALVHVKTNQDFIERFLNEEIKEYSN